MTMTAGMRRTTNHPYSAHESESFVSGAPGGNVLTWLAGSDCYVGDVVYLRANDGKADPVQDANAAWVLLGVVVGGESIGEYSEVVDESFTYHQILAGVDNQLITIVNTGIAYVAVNEATVRAGQVTGAVGGRVSITGLTQGNVIGILLDSSAAQDDIVRLLLQPR